MRTLTLAHVSDLHLGLSPAAERAATSIARSLADAAVDHVVVTGDVTHRGRRGELEQFERAFAPLLLAGRVTVVPGNHDRLTEDAAAELMAGPRVQVDERDGLYLVRLDSTGAHNRRSFISGHGELSEADIDAVDGALERAPRDALAVVLLHHHLLPLPVEDLAERIASFFRRPYALELSRGRRLLERIRGRCDLVLHGHRHVPSETRLFAEGPRALGVYNAGSSSTLGRVRLFRHAAGALVDGPAWMQITPAPRPDAVAADLLPAPISPA